MINAAAGSFAQVRVAVPEDGAAITVRTTDATTDFDIYAASAPLETRDDATWFVATFEGNEILEITDAPAGELFIMLWNDSGVDGSATLMIEGLGDGTTEESGVTPIEPGAQVPFEVDANAFVQFVVQVPASAGSLTVATTGATADLDLYVRFGQVMANRNESDAGSVTFDWDESMTIDGSSLPTIQAGPLYILVWNDSREAATGAVIVSLDGMMAPAEAMELDITAPHSFEIDTSESLAFTFEVPEDAVEVRVALSGTTDDLDLFASRRPFAMASQAVWSATSSAGNERMLMSIHREPALQAGPMFVLVYNASPYITEATLHVFVVTDVVADTISFRGEEPMDQTTIGFELPNHGADLVQYAVELGEGSTSLGLDLTSDNDVRGFARVGTPFEQYAEEELEHTFSSSLNLQGLPAGATVYVLLVSNETGNASGTLTCTPDVDAPAIEVGELTDGEEAAGSLAEGDQSDRNRYFDAFTFEGSAGQTVTIRTESRQFDTQIALFDAAGNEIAQNDDAPDEMTTNSQITITLPANGVYTVRVSSYGEFATGDYTIWYATQADGEGE